MSCTACPFAFTNASEEVQNYGCLPSAWDVMQMKIKSDHNWACHSNEKRICQGLAKAPTWWKEFSDIDTSTGNLISYETWYHKGEEAALKEADEKLIFKK